MKNQNQTIPQDQIYWYKDAIIYVTAHQSFFTTAMVMA